MSAALERKAPLLLSGEARIQYRHMAKVRSYRRQQMFVSGNGTTSAAVVAWLLDHGAQVTVTGVTGETRERLAKRIDEHCRRTARDGKTYAQLCARLTWTADARAATVDEHQLFAATWRGRIVGIAGAYGKTTTTLWTAHLIGDAVAAGYAPDRSPMAIVASRPRTAVVEGFTIPGKRTLLVNTDRDYDAGFSPVEQEQLAAQWGTHNLHNLAAAVTAARWAGVTPTDIRRRIASLPSVPHRQEVVHCSREMTVVNDAMAVTPEAASAALQRWGGPNCILICGGANGKHAYHAWADVVRRTVLKNSVFFLAGNSTVKMRAALGRSAMRGVRTYPSLEQCWRAARARAGAFVHAVVLFSPASPVSTLTDNAHCGQEFTTLVRRTVR